jgi:hypothetical protein
MRGDRRHRQRDLRALARWGALACLAFALSVQIAGAGVGPAVDADEAVAIADSVAVYPAVSSTSDESTRVSDSVGVFPPVAAGSDENATITDAVGVFPAAQAGADESVTVGDTVGVFPPVSADGSTMVSVSDEVGVFPAPRILVDESVQVSDAVTVTPAASIAADEPVVVRDDVTVTPGPYAAVDELVTVADETLVEPVLIATATTANADVEPLLLGRDETIRAAVAVGATPATSGFVMVKEGGTVVAGPLPVLAGGATFTLHGLTLGTHTLTVAYGGTPQLTPSSTTVVVHVYDYALAVAPAQSTVQRGGTTPVTVAATLVPGSSVGTSTATLPLALANAAAGVTGTFAGTLSLPTLGSSTLTLAASPGATVGASAFTVSADAGARSATAQLYVNAPPVPAGGTYTANEGGSVTLHATAADLDHDALVFTWDLNGDGTFETAGQNATFAAVDGPAVAHPAVQACDDHGACASSAATVTIANVAPTARIVTPLEDAIVLARTPVAFAGTFTDPGTLDTHTVAWSFGATTANATTTFAGPGFFTVTFRVTDKDGGVGTASVHVTVVDPDAGFVTAGGWIPQGSAKLSFGLVARYRGAAPSGEVELNAPGLVLHATAIRFLVVTGTSFELEGQGTLNGAAGYSFRVGGVNGSPDRLRARIWSTATGVSRYDSGDLRPLGGGQIQIHR